MDDKAFMDVWPEWQLKKKIGQGSYGAVYEAVRQDHHVVSRAAIKIIHIPSEPSEIASLRSEGMDEAAINTYLQGVVDAFVDEIQLMETLKGIQNIVSVEDYKVVRQTESVGWTIYIRMELLTPFSTYVLNKKMTERDVIKLGCDICTALEICGKRNILHRDIKPENIFVNDFGDYKLGDFGIAKRQTSDKENLSPKGTYNYMAPEVANGHAYDNRADLYSLGIVLYRMLNQNRLPFLETEKQLTDPDERRKAVERRFCGEKMPVPCEASTGMVDVIFRACAFDPKDRFANATEMKQALLQVQDRMQDSRDPLDRTISVRKAAADEEGTTSVRRETGGSVRNEPSAETKREPVRKKKGSKIAVFILIFVILAVVGTFVAIQALHHEGADAESSQTQSSEEQKDPNESIVKTYTGTYSEGSLQSLHGFDLEILSYDENGHVEAVFSFYNADGTKDLFGSYKMEGEMVLKVNGSVSIQLTGTEWIEQPLGYHMLSDMEVAINADRTILSSEKYELYGVEKDANGLYDVSDIVKTYSGTYTANWGVTGMDLTITSCDVNNGYVQAESYFYPGEESSKAKTGRFTMIGRVVYVYPDGSVKLALMGDEWIEEPDGAVMLNFNLTISGDRTEATSDRYQMNLQAQS